MFCAKNLSGVFRDLGEVPAADNENYPALDAVLKQIFTTSEMSQLYGLVKPYIASGHVGELSLKKGDDASSLFVLNNAGRRGNNVLFCVVKYHLPNEPVKYNMNFACSKLNLETLNFSELMRVCRLQLTMACGAPKTPEFRVV